MRHPTGHYPPLKTGAGRHRKPTPAVDVERLPCPATLGSETHEIVWRRGRMVCAWCSVEWAAIDAEARGGAA